MIDIQAVKSKTVLARAVASELLAAQEILPSKPKKVLEQGQDSWLSFDMSHASDHFQVPKDTIAQRTRKIPTVESIKEEVYA